jgi:putative tryptophan/tyrosine transport system substrate-binding protein
MTAGRASRRGLLAGFAGLMAPALARAQSSAGPRRIGILMGFAEGDPEGMARLAAFTDGLTKLGWVDGRSATFDLRWSAGNLDRLKADADAIVRAQPAAILADRSPATAALLGATRQIAIVFAQVTDPVGQNFVASLARPGGNATGFSDFEPSMGGKWLEFLKEIAPQTVRAALPYNPRTATFAAALIPSFEAAARSKGIEPLPTPVRDVAELEALIGRLGGLPGGGLVMPPDASFAPRRARIIEAVHHRLPAIFVNRYFVRAGALLSYGNDVLDQYRRAASYVDRVLKGGRPGDLPVQAPVKFELAINLKTAKALGLVVPPSLLVRADEVID